MASAGDPTAAAAGNIFNEDEDLLDDDDDDEISDHDEDESASSAAIAVDRPPPPTSVAQVTIAVPGVPDPHLKQQQQQEIVITKKPAQPDESRKLFQRLWTDEDEIELLQGFLDYTTQRCGPHSSSQHHHDTTAFYDQIKSKFQLEFNKNQLVEKLRRLKKKYRNVINKFSSGKEYTFKSNHEQATFEISSKIWGSSAVVNVNGSSAFRAGPAPTEEEDDELNNPNFADCQSPSRNGIDVNSKTPRSRKRSRAGAVKVEEKQNHPANSNINNTPPSAAVTPVAAPVTGLGMTGSMSSVIEETVKSCLSPIFKELLSNSMSSIPNPSGLCCGHGFGSARSAIPLCFTGAIGGDKTTNDRWRKQQILELEVLSKRLELVQDEIREQLQELRSMGN
ncbi:hypothetical protein CDL12_12417 [Handroanthus impetiginosus]|uniref:Glabrous enhancer-binding protein-like DBD domain-containing protein n=1 Tax=Handroanthus impetiginosus TaxID=429701 RepID=A0A2G9HBP4_9LAMI|nr:hypothetical protein CDL12_12417 [Handroanthus impetiginosus]